MSSELTVGMQITRSAIQTRFGGHPQWALPSTSGRVVAVCVHRKLNPEAPQIVFIARGPRRQGNASLLAEQSEAVPVFVKEEGPGELFTYLGNFVAYEYSEDPLLVATTVSPYNIEFEEPFVGLLRLNPV